MIINRRQFITSVGLTTLATQIPWLTAQSQTLATTIIKPPRLQVGDTIGLISPGGMVEVKDVEKAKQALMNLGLNIKTGVHILDRYGYLAGTDAHRAQDINTMFADPSVKAIIAMRGGWGCNRILPLLNYPLMRAHPKIILGYSDITSLLLAIYHRCRLITFHGPVATSTWNQFTISNLQKILFNAEAVTLENNDGKEGKLSIINLGTAKGKLMGGNLSVLTAMLGSSYLPTWKNTILFVEDIGEDIYRIDRMLTQLKNAGILNQINGFIFGQCTNCQLGEEPSLTLQQVLQDHIRPLKIPAWYGSMIGHIQDKFTLPIGLEVEIDAATGTIKLLDSPVS
ncbi:peptidase U61, LD-carboxypeptidase A [Richelia sinica FACHB-800]|uniref:Peptidase U61, LD-carboxypeptidase A n=1 Tax=Richelia sinica FACHB-800 TaxID=1357546 RepID=A0A975T4S2_9NOST|nr:LD-carboxypeptidase [Richelia sinica]MBD2664409.1 LD-carboxypeptidase [Richelia sinica FACHB-800]QXE22191.1 peptidase U61, LD-carboxypeptidase A [Richelia sinica FACHB-800]